MDQRKYQRIPGVKAGDSDRAVAPLCATGPGGEKAGEGSNKELLLEARAVAPVHISFVLDQVLSELGLEKAMPKEERKWFRWWKKAWRKRIEKNKASPG